jgi:hypothetical protein
MSDGRGSLRRVMICEKMRRSSLGLCFCVTNVVPLHVYETIRDVHALQKSSSERRSRGNYRATTSKKNIGDVQLNVQILTIHPAVIFEDSESLVE